MKIELDAEEFATLIEGLDYVKSKVAFTKGMSYADKTARLEKIEALERKMTNARSEA